MRRAAFPAMVVLLALVFAVLAAAEGSDDQAAYDIQRELRGSAHKARVEFGRQAGLTDADMWEIFRTKVQLHRMHEDLRHELEALAVMLQGPGAEEDKRAAVEDYLSKRDETLAGRAALEQALIEKVGADENPLKMGALMIFGVLDSGRRVLCAVRSEVAGGAGSGLRGAPGAEGLQQPLGTN